MCRLISFNSQFLILMLGSLFVEVGPDFIASLFVEKHCIN